MSDLKEKQNNKCKVDKTRPYHSSISHFFSNVNSNQLSNNEISDHNYENILNK